MVFIVSDQRIATENFEKGKIYKVVFLDESIFYGVCLGIGSNFVMLSGNISGYLFPLTMETASQVESIDLFDPTPPEPPVPWTNLLQYQTGEPPFTFNTIDDQLFSWYITGAGVGDKTANLFNTFDIIGQVPSIANGELVNSVSGATTNLITLSDSLVSLTSFSTMNIYLFLYDENETFIGYISRASTGTVRSSSITGYTNAKYARIRIDNVSLYDNNITLVYGSDAPSSYIPFGYKIPILCNEHLTNIYLDAPLEEDEILYSTDIDTNIITDIGNNILSVETTLQPSEMQIVYKIADR